MKPFELNKLRNEYGLSVKQVCLDFKISKNTWYRWDKDPMRMEVADYYYVIWYFAKIKASFEAEKKGSRNETTYQHIIPQQDVY